MLIAFMLIKKKEGVYRPYAKATFSRHVGDGVVSALHCETTNMCFALNFLLCYFRSENTGNCLYSSISLLLVGNNSLVESLR